MIQKPNMMGPQASRAHLAHLSADQFSTGVDAVYTDEWHHGEEGDPSMKEYSAQGTADTHHTEKTMGSGAAEIQADRAWEGAGSWMQSSFKGNGGGRVYSSKPTSKNEKFVPGSTDKRGQN